MTEPNKMIVELTVGELEGLLDEAFKRAFAKLNEPVRFEPLLLPEEAARQLGVPVELLRKWARAGLIACYKIGSLWRFRASELRDAGTLALAQGYYLDRPGVYAFRAGAHFKVGKSATSIKRRLRGLQTGQAHRFELLGVVSRDPNDEARVHRALAPFHVRGEWFSATEPALAALSQLVQRGLDGLS